MIIKTVLRKDGKLALVNRFEVTQCEVDYIQKSIHYTSVSSLTDDSGRKVGEIVKYKRLETFANEIYVDGERVIFD